MARPDSMFRGAFAQEQTILGLTELGKAMFEYYDQGAVTTLYDQPIITSDTSSTSPELGLFRSVAVTPASGSVAITSPTAWASCPQAMPSPVAQLVQRLDRARGKLTTEAADALKEFVSRLISNESDLVDEGLVPRPGAFDGLIAFFAGHPWVRMPGLTLTREGDFAAIWDNDRKDRIRFDFREQGRVRWVVVRASPEPATGSGELNLKAVDGIIETHNAKDWMAA